MNSSYTGKQKLVVPGAENALSQMKYEIANELGVNLGPDATARQNGWMSANDIRELENMDKIPAEEGGELYLINGNMLPLNKAGAYANKSKEEETDEEVLEMGKPARHGNGKPSPRT